MLLELPVYGGAGRTPTLRDENVNGVSSEFPSKAAIAMHEGNVFS